MYAPDYPSVDPLVFELGVPILYVPRSKNMMKRPLTCHEEEFVLAINSSVFLPLDVSVRFSTNDCPSVASEPA